MREIITYRQHLEAQLLKGATITGTFRTKQGSYRTMKCRIAPRQPEGYKNGLYSVIEQTEKGERYRAFNMGTLINE
jgi:hypothetical protein